jgi:hypothetical protein
MENGLAGRVVRPFQPAEIAAGFQQFEQGPHLDHLEIGSQDQAVVFRTKGLNAQRLALPLGERSAGTLSV